MSFISLLVADLAVAPTTSPGQALAGAARAHLSLAGALAAVVGLLVVWAVFVRKRPRGLLRYRSPQGYRAGSVKPTVRNPAGAQGALSRRRRWRRRRGHRPRNPTLAETGGLPHLRASRPSELAR